MSNAQISGATRRGEPDYSAEMRLPAGKTCADCLNGPICDGLFGAVKRGFASCDFWPSRFSPAQGAATDDEDHAPRCITTGQHRNDGRGMCIDCDYAMGAA